MYQASFCNIFVYHEEYNFTISRTLIIPPSKIHEIREWLAQ